MLGEREPQAWPMRLAGGLLRDGMGVADVAERVGYTSEASFSTAFKRERGLAPSRFARPTGGEYHEV